MAQVLAAPDGQEHTAIGLDYSRRHVRLDRSKSGASLDEDVRAGPWFESDATPGVRPADSVDVFVHAFVDNQLVALIANNQTALAAWVDPTRADSAHVGLRATHGALPHRAPSTRCLLIACTMCGCRWVSSPSCVPGSAWRWLAWTCGHSNCERGRTVGTGTRLQGVDSCVSYYYH